MSTIDPRTLVFDFCSLGEKVDLDCGAEGFLGEVPSERPEQTST